MGEITELILEGILCQSCGCVVNEKLVGHPVFCPACAQENKTAQLYEDGELDDI